jgi:hypothetical protein
VERGEIQIGRRDRLLAWIVTGPVGRFIAFFWDFGAAVWHGAANKLRRR